ncbi:MAG: zinc-dependent metalloprotease [Planctomycetaceae bacterium]|jgi:flagellar motor protein MotB|nr:zinc-dependent metalloprotease [Planctomycetaceae bacterium]
MQLRDFRIVASFALASLVSILGNSPLYSQDFASNAAANPTDPAASVISVAPQQSETAKPADATASLTLAELQASLTSRSSSSSSSKDAPKPLSEVVPNAETIDGLIPLHKKKNKLYAEITASNLNTDYLIAMAIARGTGASAISGYTLGFGDDWLWQFRKADDKIQIVRRNIRYKADSGTPEAVAVEYAYSDSILYSLPIIAKGPKGGDVVDLESIFMTDLPRLGSMLGGFFTRDRSSWGGIKGFKNNVEIRVDATYSTSRSVPAAPDRNSAGVTIHYSISKLPSSGYQPRIADDRIGFFTTVHKNFSRYQDNNHIVRYVNRWNLQKADSSLSLSPPKKKIIFWIEKTAPVKYRKAIKDGILEWNKAFEKIGIVDAIDVREQTENDTWDPEDINYNTFRWITADAGFAMGPSHVNPLNGEILDADIIFDAGFVDSWRKRFDVMIAERLPSLSKETTRQERLDMLRGAVPLKNAARDSHDHNSHDHESGEEPQNGHSYECAYSRLMADQIAFGALALAILHSDNVKEDEPKPEPKPEESGDKPKEEEKKEEPKKEEEKKEESQKDEPKKEESAEKKEEPKKEEKSDDKKENTEKKEEKKEDSKEKKLSPEELKKKIEEEFEKLVLAGLKDVVMHEVGHTLGLRHNFKASSWLTLEEINSPERSKEYGIAGSVMDYLPLNIMPKGEKQGDYFMSTLGPYDYLAIEYGYKFLSGTPENEKKELSKIASKQAEKGYNYATDEDARSSLNPDPASRIRDLGSDPIAYAKANAKLYEQLLPGLLERAAKEGDNYADVRYYFNVLFLHRIGALRFVAHNIGGLHVNRDHRGDPGDRAPIQVVDAKIQRDSLKYLCEQIFAADSFKIPADLYNRMGTNRWNDWADVAERPDFSLRTQLLGEQVSFLRALLNIVNLGRILDTEMRVKEGEDVLTLAELFDTLTNAVFKELDSLKEGEFTSQKPAVNTLRRSLQEKYYLFLADYASGDLAFLVDVPEMYQSLSRQQLTSISSNIQSVLIGKAKLDAASRAHLQTLNDRIQKLLNANMLNLNP